MSARNQEGLALELKRKGVFDDFCEMMFGLETKYETLLEELERWGISSSLASLSRFNTSWRGEWSLRRARKQAEDALKDEELDDAERQAVAQALFNAAANPNTDTKTLLRMRDQHYGAAKLKLEREKLKQAEVKLGHAERKLEQAERKLKLLEAKLGEAQAVAEDARLTPEEREARWKEIFGR